MMPTRSGETPYSEACWRTQVTAANPSAMDWGMTGPTSALNFCWSANRVRNCSVASPSVWARRYLRTKAVTSARGQIFGDVGALDGPGEGHETAARANDDGGVNFQIRRRFEYGQGGLRHIGDDVFIPGFGEVLLFRIGRRSGAGCGAGIEGDDILGGCDGHQRQRDQDEVEGELFHGGKSSRGRFAGN